MQIFSQSTAKFFFLATMLLASFPAQASIEIKNWHSFSLPISSNTVIAEIHSYALDYMMLDGERSCGGETSNFALSSLHSHKENPESGTGFNSRKSYAFEVTFYLTQGLKHCVGEKRAFCRAGFSLNPDLDLNLRVWNCKFLR